MTGSPCMGQGFLVNNQGSPDYTGLNEYCSSVARGAFEYLAAFRDEARGRLAGMKGGLSTRKGCHASPGASLDESAEITIQSSNTYSAGRKNCQPCLQASRVNGRV